MKVYRVSVRTMAGWVTEYFLTLESAKHTLDRSTRLSRAIEATLDEIEIALTKSGVIHALNNANRTPDVWGGAMRIESVVIEPQANMRK